MEAPSFGYAHASFAVDPVRGNPAIQVIALGLLFDVTGPLVNLAVAMAAAAARLRTPTRGALLQRVTGVIFVALGLTLALASRP